STSARECAVRGWPVSVVATPTSSDGPASAGRAPKSSAAAITNIAETSVLFAQNAFFIKSSPSFASYSRRAIDVEYLQSNKPAHQDAKCSPASLRRLIAMNARLLRSFFPLLLAFSTGEGSAFLSITSG